MRIFIFFFLLIFLHSCIQDQQSNTENTKSSRGIKDTVIVKQQNVLNKSYEAGFYSKSFSYYWLVGKDTIDFFVNAIEYEKDSTFHLHIYHRNPMLFTTLLNNIGESLPLIKQDFDITKFSSIHFRSPIYYLDLAKELSCEYEEKFGQKRISYEKLNEFLLNTTLNERLENFLNPLYKRVKRYSIEKFHLMEKKHFSIYLPDTVLKDYPAFTIEGMGVSVVLEGK